MPRGVKAVKKCGDTVTTKGPIFDTVHTCGIMSDVEHGDTHSCYKTHCDHTWPVKDKDKENCGKAS